MFETVLEALDVRVGLGVVLDVELSLGGYDVCSPDAASTDHNGMTMLTMIEFG